MLVPLSLPAMTESIPPQSSIEDLMEHIWSATPFTITRTLVVPEPDTQALADAVHSATAALRRAIDAAHGAGLEVELVTFTTQNLRTYPAVTVRVTIDPSEPEVGDES
jgi:hypothetical protein